MPVEFKGRLQGNAVILQWTTSDEVNTNEFVIEKSNENKAFMYTRQNLQMSSMQFSTMAN